ncbi:MAG: hypothetical protein WD876_00575 [Candidatus Pacearchaeota archaeon]
MVYKKYIKKDGKLYGPYMYESKRVDGKVVSQYHGPESKIDFRKYVWIFVSVAALIGLVYFLSGFSFGSLTGFAILNTNVEYEGGQPISGNVLMSLKEGELLPASSKLVFENEGNVYEYSLKELVSEQTVNGNFYVENTAISGSGDGYGIEGTREVYPEVSFVLTIYSTTDESGGDDASGETQTETTETEINNETDELAAEETVVEESVSIIEEPTAEEPLLETSEETQTETTESTGETSIITGFFVKTFNFFLNLGPTGRAIDEGNGDEIQGTTYFGNSFLYELSGGEGVQLKEGSVYVNGESVSDETVRLNVDGNQVSVETSYFETETGFGGNYIGDGEKIISIDLSQLDLVLNEGELKIRIINGNEEIISSSLNLVAGTTQTTSEEISNETEMNVTIEVPVIEPTENLTDETIAINPEIQVITAETVGFILTEEEKQLLAEEFGNASLEKTKSEIFNGRIIIRYEIGNKWIEYNYEESLSDEELAYQMSVDRMKWLKDLAYRIKLNNQGIR